LKALIEVFTKAAGFDLFEQVAMGGGDDARAQLDALDATRFARDWEYFAEELKQKKAAAAAQQKQTA
jgi:hypothetical protein